MNGPYYQDGDRRRGILSIVKLQPIDFENLARELLHMDLDSRLDHAGGYQADVDWESFPDHVVVADLDPAKEYHRPMILIYDKKALFELAESIYEDVREGPRGGRMKGARLADAIYEAFCEELSECEKDRVEARQKSIGGVEE